MKFPNYLIVELLQNSKHIGYPHSRHIAHAAVRQNLHFGSLPLADFRAEIRRNFNPQVDFTRQQQLIHINGFFDNFGNSKGFVSANGVNQHPTFRRAAEIQQTNGNVADIGCHHIAKQNKLHQRSNNQQRPVLFIPKELNEFLSH